MSSEWNTRAKSYRLQKKQLKKKKDCNAVSNEIVTWWSKSSLRAEICFMISTYYFFSWPTTKIEKVSREPLWFMKSRNLSYAAIGQSTILVLSKKEI